MKRDSFEKKNNMGQPSMIELIMGRFHALWPPRVLEQNMLTESRVWLKVKIFQVREMITVKKEYKKKNR